jgi:hypothetical protein
MMLAVCDELGGDYPPITARDLSARRSWATVSQRTKFRGWKLPVPERASVGLRSCTEAPSGTQQAHGLDHSHTITLDFEEPHDSVIEVDQRKAGVMHLEQSAGIDDFSARRN